MKTCSVCNHHLPLNCFAAQASGKMGRRADCKDCVKRFTRTEEGLAKALYSQQKSKSKKRGYCAPAYTEAELLAWMRAQNNFRALFDAWVDSGYQTTLRPSVDRLNDLQSYTLTNIQLVTAETNVNNYYSAAISGANTKTADAVDQLDMDGNFIKRFHSLAAAAREFNGIPSNIRSAILQKPTKRVGTDKTYIVTTAYGYKWRYSTIPNDKQEVI